MHSIIIPAFCRAFKKSFIYRAFDKLYITVSDSFKNSFFLNKIKNMGKSGAEAYSILYKIIRTPFYALEKIGEKAGDKILKAYEDSFILNSAFAFLDNALALNSKFYGLFLLAATVSYQAFGSFSLKLAPFAVIGVLAILVDYNVTDFFKESKLVKFALSVVGFSDISWDFYKKENIKKPVALVLAAFVGILAGVLLHESLIFALLPFAALVGAMLVLRCPAVGIFSSAFLAPFIPTMLLAALTVYTALCFCFKSVITKDFKWHIDGVGTGWGFFLIFMLISSLFSFNLKKSIMVWGLYFIFIGYHFIIINAIETKKQLYSIIKLFVIAGLLVSIYGILQYIFGWDTSNAWIDEEMFEAATMRAYSTMGNPNVLGEYLLLVIPLSVYLLLTPNSKILEKIFWLGTAGLCTICMVFTQSRGCWIGLAAAVAIFVTLHNGRLWGLLPFAVLALPFILPEAMIDRFLSVGNLEDSSTSYRVFIWLGTIAMLRDFWLGGIGMGEGAFRKVYPFYSYNTIIAPHSHNLYLQLIVEGGICALLIFIITILVYFKNMHTSFSKSEKRGGDAIFSAACISAVAGFLIQSMFDYTFYNYRMMAMFFMIIALSSLLCRKKEADSIEDN